jgi:signal transduction histidine kinase
VLKNLLSNALKFTEQGSVRLSIDKAISGWSREPHDFEPREIGHRVFGEDTGIGIRDRKAAHHL